MYLGQVGLFWTCKLSSTFSVAKYIKATFITLRYVGVINLCRYVFINIPVKITIRTVEKWS